MLLAVLAVGCLVAGLHASSGPVSNRLQSRPQAPVATVPRPAAQVAQDPPVLLRIPAIGVSHRLVRLGLQADGTVQVPAPSEAAYPGWFALGPAPGQSGSSVILGHVDSLDGPAVFYRLRFLTRGDRVDVALQDGAVAHFAVRRVRTYPNAAFPARRVYAPHGYVALNLVTCGGSYDPQTGYQSNVVAYTRLVGTTPPPRPSPTEIRRRGHGHPGAG